MKNFNAFKKLEQFTKYDQHLYLLSEDNSSCIRIANNLKLRRSAYELIYKLYRKKGYTDAHDSEMWLSSYNLLPETTTLAVLQNNEMIGTITVVFESPLGLPGDRVFKNEIDLLRKAGRRPAEVISLGVADVERRTAKLILIKLFNYVYLVSWYLKKATDFVITVNPRHASYYSKALLFENWGPSARIYEKVRGAPAVLSRLDLETPYRAITEPQNEKLRRRTLYRYFHTKEQEWRILSNLEKQIIPMSEEEFLFFAMKETNIWNQATPLEKSFLGKHYITALMCM